MLNRLFRMAGLLAAILLLTAPARAQSPSPESTAAAKELIDTINLAGQFKNLMPIIMKNLKPAIVQGRSNVDRDYDAMMPVLLEAFQARIGELMDALAIIYSSNFSAEELHTVIGILQNAGRPEIPAEATPPGAADHDGRPKVRPIDRRGYAKADDRRTAQEGSPPVI